MIPTKQKVLIVDDSEFNRSLLSEMLTADFDTVEAGDGLEAVAYLHGHRDEVALVLLDIVMPKLDGFGVLEVMNKNHWIETIPVIMISAESRPVFQNRAYDLGATDYISRPFDSRVVRRRVINTTMLYARQKRLAGMVTEQIYEKERNNNLMIDILSNIVEFRNGESGLHVLHIHAITEMLLRRLQQRCDRYAMGASDIAMIGNASALHDIGKVAIPDHILNKPGKLTNEEYEVMKTHSMEGAGMLERMAQWQGEPLLMHAYQICRWHHERYDGRGYPDGLKGEEIPIAAQVVSLADVYDALTSDRIYKPAYPHETAMSMILHGECGVFNPLLLDCLLDIRKQIDRGLGKSRMGRIRSLEVKTIAEEMIEKKGGVSISGRTLRLLEQEKMKCRFFMSVSREIQFEYMIGPKRLSFSKWGARQLGIEEVIPNPEKSPQLVAVFGREMMRSFWERLSGTTPKMPVIEQDCLLSMSGRQSWYHMVACALWEADDPPFLAGAIGKLLPWQEGDEGAGRGHGAAC